jgi:hypothetical protein
MLHDLSLSDYLLLPVYIVLGLVVAVAAVLNVRLVWYNFRVSRRHGGFHAPTLPSGPILPIKGMTMPMVTLGSEQKVDGDGLLRSEVSSVRW